MNKPISILPGLPGAAPTPTTSNASLLPGLGGVPVTPLPTLPVYSRFDRQTEERYARLLKEYRTVQQADPLHNLKATRVALRNLVLAHFMSGNMRGDVMLAAQTWREAIIASEDPHLALDEIRLGGNVQADTIGEAYSHLFLDFENSSTFDPRYAAAFAEFVRTTNQAMYPKYARHLPHNSKDPIVIAELVAGEYIKKPRHALERIHRALADHPDHPKLLIRLAQMTEDDGNFDENLRRAEQLVEMHPEWPDAQIALARALENLGQLPQAKAVYETAMALQPSDFVAAFIEQNTRMQAEVKNEVACEKLERIHKWRNSPRYRQHQQEMQAERIETESLLEKQRNANKFERASLRAEALKAYEMKHPATAADYFDRYLVLAPTDYLLRSRYAESLMAIGKKPEALRQIRRACAEAHEAEPQHYNPEIVHSFGKILLSGAPETLGEIEQYVAPAVALHPGHKGLATLNDKVKQAWSHAERLAEGNPSRPATSTWKDPLKKDRPHG